MSALTAIITTAWSTWAAVIGTEQSPGIRLSVVPQTFSGRAQGGALGEGAYISEPVFNIELRTGMNAHGTESDINIEVDIDYPRDVLFFDTTPETGDDIPAYRTDALSVFVHEIGHAIGFNGYGLNPGHNFRTAYDLRSQTVVDGFNTSSDPIPWGLTAAPCP